MHVLRKEILNLTLFRTGIQDHIAQWSTTHFRFDVNVVKSGYVQTAHEIMAN